MLTLMLLLNLFMVDAQKITYTIDDVLSFQLSDGMRQKYKYGTFKGDKYVIPLSALMKNNIVFMPYDISTYSRVLIYYSKTSGLTQEILENIGPVEIDYMEPSYHDEIIERYGNSADFIWYPLSVKKVGNSYAIVRKFQRPAAVLGTSPVLVIDMQFYFKSCAFNIIVSYRTKEKELWELQMQSFINSINFKL